MSVLKAISRHHFLSINLFISFQHFLFQQLKMNSASAILLYVTHATTMAVGLQNGTDLQSFSRRQENFDSCIVTKSTV